MPMNISPYTSIVEHIRTVPRRILPTKLFRTPTRMCLLDFIGAPEYFITDFGAVWSRKKVYPDKHGKLNRGYLPMVQLDSLPYAWVSIPISGMPLWFPVNQLLGWSFEYQEDKMPACFVSALPSYWSAPLSQYSWQESTAASLGTSVYRTFMTEVYPALRSV